jgi:hypothetical protein
VVAIRLGRLQEAEPQLAEASAASAAALVAGQEARVKAYIISDLSQHARNSMIYLQELRAWTDRNGTRGHLVHSSKM